MYLFDYKLINNFNWVDNDIFYIIKLMYILISILKNNLLINL